MTLESFDTAIKDRYPRPGDRIKQYVLDERREAAWANETAPCVYVPEHEDNTGVTCGESGPTPWHHLEMAHCCSICGALAESHRHTQPVDVWIFERSLRPKPCDDKTKLSDDVAPPLSSMTTDHPLVAMLNRRLRGG